MSGLAAKVKALGVLARSVRRLAPEAPSLPAPAGSTASSTDELSVSHSSHDAGTPSTGISPGFDGELAHVLRVVQECWGAMRACDRRLRPWEQANVPLVRLRGAAPGSKSATKSAEQLPAFQQVPAATPLAEQVVGQPPASMAPPADAVLSAAWGCGLATRAGAFRDSVVATGAGGGAAHELRNRARSVAAGRPSASGAVPVENPVAKATAAQSRPRRGSVPARGAAHMPVAAGVPSSLGAAPPTPAVGDGVTSGPRRVSVAPPAGAARTQGLSVAPSLSLLGYGGRDPGPHPTGGGPAAPADVHVREYGALLIEIAKDLAGVEASIRGALRACSSRGGGVEF